MGLQLGLQLGEAREWGLAREGDRGWWLCLGGPQEVGEVALPPFCYLLQGLGLQNASQGPGLLIAELGLMIPVSLAVCPAQAATIQQAAAE